ncbi:peptidoglycan DD-metalloendopeptidase family protein [Phormidesmis sp. 146-35]
MAQGQLNAGHLGGRFLKRAFPQEINPVPFSAVNNDALTEQPKQALPESNRRVRTSAAMIGLAISMGAYGVLAPQQGEAAVAAEPVPAEPTAATIPDVAVLPPLSEAAAAVQSEQVKHTVQEGQTLWRIAQLYRLGVSELATLNNLRPDSVLYVGQVLQVPASASTVEQSRPDDRAAVSATGSTNAVVPSLTEPVAVIASSQPGIYTPGDESQQLKSKQDAAVQSLKQQRDRLKQSLAELKSEESENGLASTAEVPSPAEVANLMNYQVNAGETLSSIAQAHGVSSSELVKINQLSNPNLLKVNQSIKIPQSSAALPSQVASVPVASVSDRLTSVTVPVVPSLSAATNQPTAPSVSVNVQPIPSTAGVGGDAEQFALVNPSGITSGGQYGKTQAPQASQAIDSKQPDQYVNNLVSEVVKLRQKYQSRGSSQPSKPLFSGRTQAPAPSTLNASTRRVNPEFRPSRNLETLQAELRSLQQRERKSEKPQAKKPQIVAAAPAGSESYAPLMRSSVGKMVSPSLPPLGKPDSYLPGSGKFAGYIWPAKGMLTSPYGWRWGRMHKGIDIAAPIGTPIVAAAPGKVITAGWNDGGYGNLVEVKHADGSVTLYGHNNRILVKVGQQVAQGQQIAEMGSTGFSTGPHSHFEVHLPGQGAVNPIAYLPQNRG